MKTPVKREALRGLAKKAAYRKNGRALGSAERTASCSAESSRMDTTVDRSATMWGRNLEDSGSGFGARTGALHVWHHCGRSEKGRKLSIPSGWIEATRCWSLWAILQPSIVAAVVAPLITTGLGAIIIARLSSVSARSQKRKEFDLATLEQFQRLYGEFFALYHLGTILNKVNSLTLKKLPMISSKI